MTPHQRGPKAVNMFVAVERTVYSRPLFTNAVALVGFSLLVLYANRGLLFLDLDGAYMRTLVLNQFQWMPFGIDLASNPLQGMWNVFIGYNMNLVPALALQSYTLGGQIQPVLTYTIFVLELAIATYLLGTLLALPGAVRLLAAWLLPLLTLPFIWPPIFYPIYALIPQCVDLILGEAVILVGLARVGRRSLRVNLLWGVVIILVVAWLVAATPLMIVTIVPTVIVGCIVIVLSSRTRHELLWRLISLMALGAIMFGAGFVHALIGQTLYSVPNFFSDELSTVGVHPGLEVASVFFQWRGAGASLVVLSLIGSSMVAVYKSEMPRNFAIMHIFLTTICVVGGFALVRYFNTWRGPHMLYFEISIWPFYCLYAAYTLVLVLPWLAATANNIGTKLGVAAFALTPRRLLLSIGGMCLVFIAVLAVKRHAFMPSPFTSAETSLVKLLRAEIGLEPGTKFRGRVVSFAGGNLDRPISWVDQYAHDMRVWRIAGNDSRSVGLWRYGIPTLLEYNHYLTPPAYLLLSRLLARPIDRQLRNIMALTVPAPGLLRALGTRFIISDRELPDEQKLREVFKWGRDVELRLYELSGPNLGNYSPTTLIRADNAGSVLEILKGNFDFSRVAVVNEPVDEQLVPVLSAELEFTSGAMRVRAMSPGRSFLVLPVEFSRCIELSSSRSSETDVRLLRSNLAQLGLLFSGKLDVTVAFRSGPLKSSRCRLRDIEDMYALDIVGAAKLFPLVLQEKE